MSDVMDGKRKSRSEKKADRREAIKVAAIEVFSERGYHATKISEIVRRVGVAQGTFYLYYESKQQIFGELLTDFLTPVVETVANWESRRARLRARCSAKSSHGWACC
ncbi:MAG: TetR/AcrR family transcriptional regulator [bacterium]